MTIKLPERYQIDWRAAYTEKYTPFLGEDMTVLDIGSGRKPAIELADRPAGSTYIGLDISAQELALAKSSDYDATITGDIATPVSDLIDTIDLAVCRQVLEHVDSVPDSLNTVHSYLRPGGAFVALLSGRNAHFALINRLIPEGIGKFGMEKLNRRPPDTVFRAHYDNCTYSKLSSDLQQWSRVEVFSHFRGAGYLSFSRPLQLMYLVYEDWAVGGNRHNLATHYTIVAVK